MTYPEYCQHLRVEIMDATVQRRSIRYDLVRYLRDQLRENPTDFIRERINQTTEVLLSKFERGLF